MVYQRQSPKFLPEKPERGRLKLGMWSPKIYYRCLKRSGGCRTVVAGGRRTFLPALMDATGCAWQHQTRTSNNAEEGRFSERPTQENVLIGPDGEAVLAEAGLAEFLDGIGSVLYGKEEDLRHLPPEYATSRKYTPEGDMYSFGCLAIGTSPFLHITVAF